MTTSPLPATPSPQAPGPYVQPSVPLLLTVRQAAALLGLGETKVYELTAAGALRSVKIGTARRVPHEAVLAYVANLLAAEGQGMSHPRGDMAADDGGEAWR